MIINFETLLQISAAQLHLFVGCMVWWLPVGNVAYLDKLRNFLSEKFHHSMISYDIRQEIHENKVQR